MRSDHIATFLAEAGQNTTDALCTLVTVDGFSDCYNQFTKGDCQQGELCGWNEEDECEPRNEFFVSAAADRDPALKERYRRLKNHCSSQTTEKACEK